MDNRLAHMDQASFLGLRALGYGALVQFTWIYNRPVDMDGLHRFNHNLGYGLLGRRVERSPLPFARDRWVVDRGPAGIDVAAAPRPRAEVGIWAYEQACRPIDPEYGPSWRLATLPLDDGGSAVCLTASHTLADGLGFVGAIADAARGRTRELGYPLPGSRNRRRAVLEDARLTMASTPELVRALVAAARVARRRRNEVSASFASGRRPRRAAGDDHPAVVPSVSAYVDLRAWDACANSLGGNANTLLAGFAGRMAVRAGRVGPDGTVTLSLPISDRTDDDTRGNAVVMPVASMDPANLAVDLGEARVKAKEAFADLSTTSDELLAPLPLTSMTPQWVARGAAGVGLGTARLPVGCSNLGEQDPAVNRPDGTDADYASGRLVEPGIPFRMLNRMSGQLYAVSGRLHGKVWISVNAWLPGRQNSRDAVRELVAATLNEFDLTAEFPG